MSYDIKRSVSLYSYQDEYYNKQLDLEGCLRETAKTGATGVELLAHIFLYQSLTQKNGILVVVTFPCHESDQWVLTKCNLTV